MPERRKPKIQIGRRTSDIPVVVLEQFKVEMKEHVEKAIEKHVNGGIRNIDTKLTNYIKEDTDWKNRAEPLVIAYEGSKWTFGFFTSVLKFLGLMVPLGGLYFWIKSHMP